MVEASTVLVTWAVTTVCFALVYFLGNVHRAGSDAKLNLALWYGASLVAYMATWIVVTLGKDELGAVLIRLTPVTVFLFVVVGRSYRARVWENVLFIAIAAIIFGVPLWRAWESGDISGTIPEARALFEKMAVLFAAAGVAYGIGRAKTTSDLHENSSR